MAKKPESITAGAVIRGLEGSRSGKASIEAAGPVDFLWAEVDQAIAQVIDNKNFADLARTWRERQSRFEPNWEI